MAGQFIVRFRDYRMAVEHKTALLGGLGMDKHWKYVDRNNAAAKFPTDFALLSIELAVADTVKVRPPPLKASFIRQGSVLTPASVHLLAADGEGETGQQSMDQVGDVTGYHQLGSEPGPLLFQELLSGLSFVKDVHPEQRVKRSLLRAGEAESEKHSGSLCYVGPHQHINKRPGRYIPEHPYLLARM